MPIIPATARSIPAMSRFLTFRRLAFFCLGFFAFAAQAQVTDPHITSWITSGSTKYARVYETTADKTSSNAVSTWPRAGLTNGGGGQSSPAYSDVQRVVYSANYVYIYTSGLPDYVMGNWLTPTGSVYTSWPTNRGAIHKIPRVPSIPTTKQQNHGSGGVLVNGVFVWENGDAQSYTTSTATVSMQGQGIWNRLAGVAEAFNFDPNYGHQPNSGAYHNHINPIALRYQLGDAVVYNSITKTYSEGTPTKHSPLIGWANDGLPIYGPYGYSSPMDYSSGVRRMVSGFQKRDGTNGTTNLATTGRHSLPKWAAQIQGKGTTETALASSEYGPATTATYQVAPGVTGTYTLGTFAEDYDYLGDLGKTQGVDFDLNRQNVRFCVTPEFPSGTYAYFVCIDASGNTQFPDIINQEYFGSAPQGQGTVTSITEPTTDYVLGGPVTGITLNGSLVNGLVLFTWVPVEGATYKVESSPDNATWTTLSSTVLGTSNPLMGYQAPVANYFRVTLIALASYDTLGMTGTPIGTTGTFIYALPPSITTQPQNVSAITNTSATFTVVASGTGPLSYQWQKGANSIAGATSASYTIPAVQTADAGSYTCVVTSSAGTVTSSAATLTVVIPTVPVITTSPTNLGLVIGGNGIFSVVASGVGLTYQWYKDSAPIVGATSASLALTNVQTANAGTYYCIVTNGAGTATSANATLTVTAQAVAPQITTQPQGAVVVTGNSVSFTVAASGTTPLTYQWRKNGTAIGGATSATYTIASAQTGDAGSYSCVITNSAGTATSSNASLTVNLPVPVVTTPPVSAATTSGGNATFSVVASGAGPFTYQWTRNGNAITGATNASLTVTNVQPLNAGLYRAAITNNVGTTNTDAAILGVASTLKVIGGGTEVLADLVHQNGNVYDQVLLGLTDNVSGATAATMTADPGQIVRTSFLDNTDDIVQVEFSGSGTLSIVLDSATGPSLPVKYNQSVAYMKGHPAIVITGADETTNISVFSVGAITAVNQSLFKSVTYDGMADVAYIAISSTNGKFGGIRTANASFFATKGFTGIYAPGVTFTGPVYLGDINAFDQATPVLILGSASDVRVTGGDLLQTNASPVQVSGFTSVRFVDGSTSHGVIIPAKTNRATFQRNGVDVTDQIQTGP